MTRITPYVVLVVTVALVTAAGVGTAGAAVAGPSPGSASQTDGEDEEIRLRIVHASPDAPPVDVSVDGEVVASDLAFGEEAAVTVDQPGNHSVEITAADDASTALASENVTLESGTDYTIAAAGEVSEGAETQFEPLVIAENETSVGEDEAAVGLVHLSPDAPPVDVTENSTGEVVFENVSYRDATERVVLPAGDYTLDVRAESDANDGEIVDSFDVSLAGDSTYTAFAIGYVSGENTSEDRAFTLLLSDDASVGDGANATDGVTTEGTPTDETTTEGTPGEGTATEGAATESLTVTEGPNEAGTEVGA